MQEKAWPKIHAAGIKQGLSSGALSDSSGFPHGAQIETFEYYVKFVVPCSNGNSASCQSEENDMKTRHIVTTACAVSILALAPFHTAAMGNAERTTYLTFSQPVQLPGVSLAPGTYTFQVVSTSGDVVLVRSRDRKTSYFMGFTHRVPKPHGIRTDTVVSLGETARATAPSISVWWHEDGDGHQFIYAKK